MAVPFRGRYFDFCQKLNIRKCAEYIFIDLLFTLYEIPNKIIVATNINEIGISLFITNELNSVFSESDTSVSEIDASF
ncbi:hypothetical protein PBNK65E_000031900 [Plasmodium berghei]|nr:hypothetical protein PBK173_000033900 [Plasmodium berghei]SCL90554.1 hypothetical protein PBNK65NY_000031400 [Plasmodium berghei]SCM15304.1 hypothetical protein PBSP11A_000031500 [Plasmodium berghei]SCN22060.1 hypothetical protein PBNK65E_000031900 [Plasmodium berghei]